MRRRYSKPKVSSVPFADVPKYPCERCRKHVIPSELTSVRWREGEAVYRKAVCPACVSELEQEAAFGTGGQLCPE